MRIKRHCISPNLFLVGFVVIVAALSGARASEAAASRRLPAAKKPSLDESRLRARLDVNPNDREAYKQLLALLDKRYAFRSIAALHAMWIKNNPSDYIALIGLDSTARAALHDPEYAIAETRSFLLHTKREEDDLSFDQTVSRLAHELTYRSRPEEGLKLVDSLIELNPNDRTLDADRAYPLVRLGRVDEAIDAVRKTVLAARNSESLHVDLADLLFRKGVLSDAESEYRAGLSVYDAKYHRGETTSSLDDLAAKMVEIEAKSRSEHTLATMHLKLARCLAAEKLFDEAIDQTRLAFVADRNAYSALYLRAEIYDQRGDAANGKTSREDARRAIDREAAAELKGRPAKILIDPVLVMLTPSDDDGGDFAPLSFAEEIVQITKGRGDALGAYERVILADALVELGRIEDADTEWRKALAAEPKLDNAIARSSFGQHLLAAGATEKALPHLRRAYELDPQNVTYRIDLERAKNASRP
jgi:tetratricopeptide (TPR) repeat protein